MKRAGAGGVLARRPTLVTDVQAKGGSAKQEPEAPRVKAGAPISLKRQLRFLKALEVRCRDAETQVGTALLSFLPQI